jgi:hypothetical protein
MEPRQSSDSLANSAFHEASTLRRLKAQLAEADKVPPQHARQRTAAAASG